MIKFYFSILRFFKKKKYDRHVPLGDLIFDRSNTANFYKFGEGTSCYNNVLIIGDVKVGKNCWIGPNVILDGSGGLTIKDNCTISAGVHIYTHNSLDRVNIKRKPVNIEDNVYVGPNSVIQMGISVGQGAVIGALSFVNKDIPEHEKHWGIPARRQV